jgi:hypothetical protein
MIMTAAYLHGRNNEDIDLLGCVILILIDISCLEMVAKVIR